MTDQPDYPSEPPTTPLPAQPTGFEPPPPPRTALPPTFLPPPPPPGAATAEGLPAYAQPAPSHPGRKTGGLVAVAIAVVVVLAAGAFAVVSLQSSSKGASSPEAAVRNLFDALDHEDAIGVLETLAPGERDVLVPAVRGIKDELVRLGITNEVDLGAVPGVDLKVEGLALSSHPIFDGVTRVDLDGGTVTASTKPGSVPVGQVLRDLIEGAGGSVRIPATTKRSDVGGQVVTVQENGSWYVSVLFSLAELARTAAGADVPDPAAAVTPVGADSPEKAVEGFLRQVSDMNLEGMIARLDPAEMRALQVYAPLFLKDAQHSLDQSLQESGVSFKISDLKLSSTDGRLGKVVVVDAVTLKIDAGDQGTASVEVADGCVRFDLSGDLSGNVENAFGGIPEGQRLCAGDLASQASDNPLASDLVDRLTGLKSGMAVAQHDGQWYVAPARTVFGLVLDLAGVLDRSMFEKGGSIYELIVGH